MVYVYIHVCSVYIVFCIGLCEVIVYSIAWSKYVLCVCVMSLSRCVLCLCVVWHMCLGVCSVVWLCT